MGCILRTILAESLIIIRVGRPHIYLFIIKLIYYLFISLFIDQYTTA